MTVEICNWQKTNYSDFDVANLECEIFVQSECWKVLHHIFLYFIFLDVFENQGKVNKPQIWQIKLIITAIIYTDEGQSVKQIIVTNNSHTLNKNAWNGVKISFRQQL